MATYVYETIPQTPGETVRQFEIAQSMRDAPLTVHPDTRQPIRRIVTGGYGLMARAGKSSAGSAPAASCSPGCACHRGPRIPAL